MRWLITVSSSLDDSQLQDLLAELSCETSEDAGPIPLEQDVVIEVEGPPDLPEMTQRDARVIAVHPSSDMDLYD